MKKNLKALFFAFILMCVFLPTQVEASGSIGSLTIENNATYEEGFPEDVTMTYEVTYDGETENSVSVELEAGGSYVKEDLPIGTTYTVVQAAYDNSPYALVGEEGPKTGVLEQSYYYIGYNEDGDEVEREDIEASDYPDDNLDDITIVGFYNEGVFDTDIAQAADGVKYKPSTGDDDMVNKPTVTSLLGWKTAEFSYNNKTYSATEWRDESAAITNALTAMENAYPDIYFAYVDKDTDFSAYEKLDDAELVTREYKSTLPDEVVTFSTVLTIPTADIYVNSATSNVGLVTTYGADKTAKFTLTDSDGYVRVGKDSEKNEGGWFPVNYYTENLFSEVGMGTYTLTQSVASEGYLRDANEYIVIVARDGSVTIDGAETNELYNSDATINGAKLYVAGETPIDLGLESQYTGFDEYDSDLIDDIKATIIGDVSLPEGVSNPSYTIEYKVATSIGDYWIPIEGLAEGTIFDLLKTIGIDVTAIGSGTHEIKVTLTGDNITEGIVNYTEIVITPSGQLVINYARIDDSDLISYVNGVTFAVFNVSDNAPVEVNYSTSTLELSGFGYESAMLEGILPGDYYAKITDVPAGIKPNATEYVFSVDANGAITGTNIGDYLSQDCLYTQMYAELVPLFVVEEKATPFGLYGETTDEVIDGIDTYHPYLPVNADGSIDAEGLKSNIFASVVDTEYSVTDEDGQFIQSISGLTVDDVKFQMLGGLLNSYVDMDIKVAGTYDIRISLMDNEDEDGNEYRPSTIECKIVLEDTRTVPVMVFGQVEEVGYTSDITGLKAVIEENVMNAMDTENETTDVDENASYTVEYLASTDNWIELANLDEALDVGDYTLRVIHQATSSYREGTSDDISLTIKKGQGTITVNSMSIAYGEEYVEDYITTMPEGIDTAEVYIGVNIDNEAIVSIQLPDVSLGDIFSIGDGLEGLTDLWTLLSDLGLSVEWSEILNIDLTDGLGIDDILGIVDSQELFDALLNNTLFEDKSTEITILMLQSLLDVSDTVDISSELLRTALQSIGVADEDIDSIFAILPEEVLDIQITGKLPEDSGIYGTLSFGLDDNYDVTPGVGMLVITMNTENASLEWNQIIEEDYIELNALGGFDFDATFYENGEASEEDIQYIYFSLDEENFAYSEDEPTDSGLYAEIAYMGLNNTYGTPILRTFLVPWTLEITYDLQDGIIDGSSENITLRHVVGLGLYECLPKEPTKVGHSFVEWNTQADGSGESINTDEYVVTRDSDVFYAIYEPNEYLVTINHYKENLDGTAYVLEDEDVTTSMVAYGTELAAIDFAVDYTGFTKNEAETVETGVVDVDGITLNVYYDRDDYTINFVGESGDILSEPYTLAYETIGVSYNGEDRYKAETPKYSYEFLGWRLDGDLTGAIKNLEAYEVTQDAKFIEVYDYILNSYQVTASVENGTLGDSNYASETVDYGERYTVNYRPNENYHLASITVDDVSIYIENYEDSYSIEVTTNHAISIVYAKDTYQVTYVYGGTEETETITVGENPSDIPSAEKIGYTYEWQDEQDAQGETVDLSEFTMEANASIRVSPVYTAIDYNITYTNVDDEEHSNVSKYTVEDKIQLSDAIRTGYEFLGWFYADNSQVTAIGAGETGHISLRAEWEEYEYEEDTYEVTYVYGDTEETETILVGKNPTNIPSVGKIGYTYEWQDEQKEIVDLSEFTMEANASITVSAVYTAIDYDITYTNVDDTEHSNALTYTVEDRIELLDARRTGYEFLGWFDAEDFPVRVIRAGETGHISLRAKWEEEYEYEEDTYEVTYVYGGTEKIETILVGEKPSNVPSAESVGKIGYTYEWQDAQGKTVDLSKFTMEANASIIVSAVYTANEYTLTYKYSTTTASAINVTTTTAITVKYGEPVSEVPEASKTGAKHIGWSTIDGADLAQYGVDMSGFVMGNQPETLYAVYTDSEYLLTYKHNGIETIIGLNYGDEPSNIPTVIKEGYNFEGWLYEESVLPTNLSGFTMPAGDVELVAYFEVNQYEILWQDYDGRIIKEVEDDYDTKLEYPEDPAREHYTFAGWDIEISNIPSSNKVITAQYNAEVYTVVFENYDGEVLKTIKEVYGTDISDQIPENPTRSGYTFTGWNKEITSVEGSITYSPVFIKNGTSSSGGNSTSGRSTGSNSSSNDDVVIIEDDIIPEAVPAGMIEYYSPYIYGYEDGTFRPEAAISRIEMVAIFARILDLDVDGAPAHAFTDVDSMHWGSKYLNALSEIGLISGYDDGTFRPDEVMNRAEIATLISNYWTYVGYDAVDGDTPLTDIEGNWAQKSIEQVYLFGLVSGMSDMTYQPDSVLTREAAVTIINNLIGRPEYDAEMSSFDDVDTSRWSYGDIESATRIFSQGQEATETE